MKIGWTYIINSKSDKTVALIQKRILENYNTAINVKSELYYKDKSKTILTFDSHHDDFELTDFLTNKLPPISSHWHLSLSNDIMDINGFTSDPKNQHHNWVSFTFIGSQTMTIV